MRRKWSQLLYDAKRKASRHHKSLTATGGGPLETPAPTAEEEQVLETLDPVMVEGIAGGVDTRAGPTAIPHQAAAGRIGDDSQPKRKRRRKRRATAAEQLIALQMENNRILQEIAKSFEGLVTLLKNN